MRGRTWFWSILGLLGLLIFHAWWRGHTIGPDLRRFTGLDLYPVTGAASEPLDCDEAIYAYIGKRIARGAVMYRDLTENKPPGGYWLYALSVAIGGDHELTIRLMPIPFVLTTTVLVWWLALRLRGPGAALIAAGIFAIVSTDPFLFGNGANMEPLINLFATASLALIVSAWGVAGRGRIVAAGVALGAACLIKQVAATHGLVFAVALLLRQNVVQSDGPVPRPVTARLRDVSALALGVAFVWGLAALILLAQGTLGEAYEDIVQYASALARETPPAAHAPPFLVRWVTGNADPSGTLPWPFGQTAYLVWWGDGSWPVWLAAVPALFVLLFGTSATAARRLVAAWTLSAWWQVALPGLFWQHYYLLPVPGLAVVVAVVLAEEIALTFAPGRQRWRHGVVALLLMLGLAWTARTQVVEYFQVAPEELTVRDKGGRQWLTLRDLGIELSRRARVWPHPTLFVWGWQSPLFFYSGLDGVTRQVFTDDFLKTFAGTNHPQARPRVERTMRDLAANPPSLIFVGYPPFPALRAFLDAHYLPSHLVPTTPDGRGLWVERGRYGEFETSEESQTAR